MVLTLTGITSVVTSLNIEYNYVEYQSSRQVILIFRKCFICKAY